ncbi:MAG: hypothetical protein K9K64_01000 [Desulfohalobiaceae bacterium]|nr:hypothetical protein [Desulfohalobiaceae bacterium]
MKYLNGLKEYLDAHYEQAVLDQARASGREWVFHLHGDRSVVSADFQNERYELIFGKSGPRPESVHKTEVKFFYPQEQAEAVAKSLKLGKTVRAKGLGPLYYSKDRCFVKNKSLYPLMLDREVVLVTLLEGEILRGLISGFNRYEISLHLKGGVPVTLLRHAIFAFVNKKGRSFLKKDQERLKDWQKSAYFIEAT